MAEMEYSVHKYDYITVSVVFLYAQAGCEMVTVFCHGLFTFVSV